MYTRAEKSQIKQAFWTAYGQYMNGVPVREDEEGKKKNWLNYKTGVRGIRFKTDADLKTAYIGIELSHKDPLEREAVFQKFLSLKSLLESRLEEQWIWEKDFEDEFEKHYARIFIKREGLNVLKEADWPELISFFKPRMIALDNLWAEVKDLFDPDPLV